MLRPASTIVALAALMAMPATAQAPPKAAYQPVAVKIPDAPGDQSFAAFRNELAAAARRRVYAELARLVVTRDFFWERDFGGSLDRGKTGIENLAVAIGLERGDGNGWTMLAMFAAETAAAPVESRPGILCAPARPQFDEAEFAALIGRTGTDTIDWAYPRNATVGVRATASMTAAVIETLGLHFVRVLGTTTNDEMPLPGRNVWTQVAAPSGKIGFVAPAMLISPQAEQLCYAKDITGRWRIVGFVGSGN